MQYKLTRKFVQFQNLSSAFNNDDASEVTDFRNELTVKQKHRNKLFKMGDRSVVGWETVPNY